MTALKLHYDGWLKLPASLQHALGTATGDLLEVVAAEGGLVLRKAATPASTTIEATSPSATAPAPAAPPAAEIPALRQRSRSRKAVTAASASKPSPAGSIALPPTLRAAGRRKPRAVPPPV